MFSGASIFNSDLSAWASKVSNVTNMSYMFQGASVFTSDLSVWNVSNVTDMRAMFQNANVFNSDISAWNVSNVTDMNSMFNNASAFNSDLSAWAPKVSNVTNMSFMFQGASVFTSDLSVWDVSNVASMIEMFYAARLFNSDLSAWDVSNVTDMSLMFQGASAFNSNLSAWKVSNVTDMSGMFAGASAFNSNLSAWDVSKVTDMSFMFNGASIFNSDLSAWILTAHPSISEMFIGSYIPTNPTINNLIWSKWISAPNNYTVDELLNAGLVTPTSISNICFPAGTPILTDQGIINVEKIDTSKHTINCKTIRYITQTVTLDKYLIRFGKSSLGRNIPHKTTVMSKDHQIEFQGKLVPAYRFLGFSSDVKKVKYSGEVLYNILLGKHGRVNVNGLTCETLHPENIIAQLYNNYADGERYTIISQMNEALGKRDALMYKDVVNKIAL